MSMCSCQCYCRLDTCMTPVTDGLKMHDNRIILFCIETGKLQGIVYSSKLYIPV